MRLLLLLLLAGCSSKPSLEDRKERTANFLFACFVEHGHPKKGLPDPAIVKMKLKTDAEGRVATGEVVDANFPRDEAIAECVNDRLPGIRAAKAAGTVDGAKFTVKFKDGHVDYKFEGAGGIVHEGSASAKHK